MAVLMALANHTPAAAGRPRTRPCRRPCRTWSTGCWPRTRPTARRRPRPSWSALDAMLGRGSCPRCRRPARRPAAIRRTADHRRAGVDDRGLPSRTDTRPAVGRCLRRSAPPRPGRGSAAAMVAARRRSASAWRSPRSVVRSIRPAALARRRRRPAAPGEPIKVGVLHSLRPGRWPSARAGGRRHAAGHRRGERGRRGARPASRAGGRGRRVRPGRRSPGRPSGCSPTTKAAVVFGCWTSASRKAVGRSSSGNNGLLVLPGAVRGAGAVAPHRLPGAGRQPATAAGGRLPRPAPREEAAVPGRVRLRLPPRCPRDRPGRA